MDVRELIEAIRSGSDDVACELLTKFVDDRIAYARMAPDSTRGILFPDVVDTAPVDATKTFPKFDAFWSAWPRHHRKAGRGECLEWWKRMNLEGKAPKVMAMLEAWKRSDQWTRENGAFIEAPVQWLKHRRWDGDPADMAPAQPSKLNDNQKRVRDMLRTSNAAV